MSFYVSTRHSELPVLLYNLKKINVKESPLLRFKDWHPISTFLYTKRIVDTHD